MKTRPHLHTRYELRFPPQDHTSYKWGCCSAPLYVNSPQGVVSSKETNNNPERVLLKDNNRALVARLGPEINSRACLCVLQGPRILYLYHRRTFSGHPNHLRTPTRNSFKKHIFLTCTVHLLEKYNKILQNAWFVHKDYRCSTSKNV